VVQFSDCEKAVEQSLDKFGRIDILINNAGITRDNLLMRMSDEEWERLVVQLRDVFNARGATRSDGSLKQWSNGNLQVLLEPTESGHRLRFRTLHGGASASIGFGLTTLGVTGVFAIVSAMKGTLATTGSAIVLMLTMGVAMIASGALRLPRWARLRGRQMEAIAARLALPPNLPPAERPQE